jgi:hypothetical protein
MVALHKIQWVKYILYAVCWLIDTYIIALEMNRILKLSYNWPSFDCKLATCSLWTVQREAVKTYKTIALLAKVSSIEMPVNNILSNNSIMEKYLTRAAMHNILERALISNTRIFNNHALLTFLCLRVLSYCMCKKKKHVKGIVSWGWGGLLMVSLDRYEVPRWSLNIHN